MLSVERELLLLPLSRDWLRRSGPFSLMSSTLLLIPGIPGSTCECMFEVDLCHSAQSGSIRMVEAIPGRVKGADAPAGVAGNVVNTMIEALSSQRQRGSRDSE